MVIEDTSASGRGQVPVKFLSGKKAMSDEEKARASKEHQDYEKAQRRKLHIEDMQKLHPNGLAEQKTSEGEIIRPGGSKPWLEI